MSRPCNLQRVSEARRLAADGFSQKDAAARLGVHPTYFCRFAKQHGIKFRHGLRCEGHDDRTNAMVALYRTGKTLQEIGSSYGLTRERVRQIITKSAGRISSNGGMALKAAAKKARIEFDRDMASLGRSGCTFEQWQYLRDFGREMVAGGGGVYRTPLRAFSSQRSNAFRRGIEWDLTLWQWWQIWEVSGRWSERGRGFGYVMCRRGDIGPYAVGNVYIATGAQNCSDRIGKISGLPCGVCKTRTGYVAHRNISGKPIYLGTYPTADLAHSAYLAQRKLVEFIRPRFGRSRRLTESERVSA